MNKSLDTSLSINNKLLRLVQDLLLDSMGGDGTDYIDVASGAITGKAYKFLVMNEDAVFSVLTDSGGGNMLTTQGLTAKTISKYIIIRAYDNLLIEDITVSSGSVIGIK